jgi:maltodextrin utilization protein YvdJ
MAEVKTVEVIVSKKWYLSKTIYINAIMLTGAVAQQISGKDIITPELQVVILSVINLILRSITKENITW